MCIYMCLPDVLGLATKSQYCIFVLSAMPWDDMPWLRMQWHAMACHVTACLFIRSWMSVAGGPRGG